MEVWRQVLPWVASGPIDMHTNIAVPSRMLFRAPRDSSRSSLRKCHQS